MDEYLDDIRIDRLAEFFPVERWSWGGKRGFDLNDITKAVQMSVSEISDPYGDEWNHPVLEEKPLDWHIGRVVYFIKHPYEIKGIEIDNKCSNGSILPIPVIVDGWHRYIAARWLYKQGQIEKVSCLYGGRMDVLAYLKGETDILQIE